MDYLNQRGGEVKLQDVKVIITKKTETYERRKKKEKRSHEMGDIQSLFSQNLHQMLLII